MDEYLDDAWQSGERPFHGSTVRNDDSVDLPTLRASLTVIADFLERRYGRGQKLLVLDDWHEHDGFGQTGARVEWPAVRAMFADDRRLANTSTGDFNVYRAVYPVSAEWLLRWYVGGEDPPDNPPECEFTFSADDAEAREVAELLGPTVTVSAEGSAAYFRARYAG